MRSILRSVAVNTASLFALTYLMPSVTISGGIRTTLTVAAVISALNLFVKPILELVFLPVNLLTLGAFRWVSAVAILWITTMVTDGLTVQPFHFPGYVAFGVVLPSIPLSLFATYVFAAFLFSFSSSFVGWIFR